MSSPAIRPKFRIIFVIGPSGVGKNWFSGQVKDYFHLHHIDIDVKGHFDAYGLKEEWDKFINTDNCLSLKDRIQDLIPDKNQLGALISLPSQKALNLNFHRIQILQSHSISTILLWGKKEYCKNARLERDSTINKKFVESEYDRKNDELFKEFGKSVYNPNRIEMFKENGQRSTIEEIMNQISNKELI